MAKALATTSYYGGFISRRFLRNQPFRTRVTANWKNEGISLLSTHSRFSPRPRQQLRNFCANTTASSTNVKPQEQNKVKVTFKTSDGQVFTAKGNVGDTLLDVVFNNNIPLDGFGACEGTLACSTCHCIFKQKDFDQLPEQPCDEELDMLDLAYELCDTSRLGCQIELTKGMDGLEVEVPAGVADARLS